MLSLDRVVDLYFNQQQSLSEIAQELDVKPSTVSRFLKRNGYTLRSKSEAQKVSLEQGRSNHPTKGKKLSNDTKTKISKSITEVWANMDKDELEKYKERHREIWANMSDEQKEKLLKSANDAVRKAAKEGSALERHLVAVLSKAGYKLEFHKKNFLFSTQLEVDIYLTDHLVAIEVDGPSHFLPIWGEDKLEKQQKADSLKHGILSAYGMPLIRVANPHRNCSQTHKREAAEKLLAALKDVIKHRTLFTEIEV